MNDNAALLAAILRVEAKLDALLQQHNGHRLSSDDQRKLEALLPLLEGTQFYAGDLRAAALARHDMALAQALDACGSTKALGKLFARAAGVPVRDLIVERIGNRDPMWRVRRATFAIA